MRRVLVTHIESPVGRRLAKALYHDPEVALVVGVGTESEPTFLAPYRGKVAYQRLARSPAGADWVCANWSSGGDRGRGRARS
jgi:hypothetical protein